MAWTIGRRMGRMRLVKIRWHVQKEHRFPFGSVSPDPDWFEPIGFPPPWPDRPWVYAVMVASANGVVAWPRSGPDDDPVLAILGRDDARDERIADRRHMRHLRCFGDVAIGAQTLRDQPRLVQTPREPGEAPMPALYRFRLAHGLTTEPRHVVYSLRGGLDPALPAFNTPGVEVIVLTTAARRAGGAPPGSRPALRGARSPVSRLRGRADGPGGPAPGRVARRGVSHRDRRRGG